MDKAEILRKPNIGKFKISTDFFDLNFNLVKKIMGDIVLLDVKTENWALIVTGISEKFFNSISNGAEIPEYQFTINGLNPKKPIITCEEIEIRRAIMGKDKAKKPLLTAMVTF